MPSWSSMRIIAGTLYVLLACCALGGSPRAAEIQAKEKNNVDPSWAYRTPARPEVPMVRNRAWLRNPIDAFILAKLEAAGLTPSPEADRLTLIRRLTFDLTGLPPTPEETEAFVQDPSPDAYERLVDRLLASPRHGERWALYWLDLVRYAESDGFKSDDARPTAWRYRDYVIAAFNGDKPYDRFMREQLAGDELYANDRDALIATGFNRHFPDEYNAVNLEQRRQEILNDMTDTTSQVFLALTVGCARCHDHKFDPILQTDYYRLQAFFASYSPADVPLADPKELQQYREQLHEWETKTTALRRRLAEIEEPYRSKFSVQRKQRFPKEYQEAYETPAEKRTPLQQQLATMVAKQVEVQNTDVAKAMKADMRQEWDNLNKQMNQFARLKPPQPPTTMTLTDIGSGLNTERKSLQRLLALVQDYQVAEVVVTFADRLTRFGLSYLRTLFSGYGVTLTVLSPDEDKTPEQELTQDLVAIITSFAGRLYGLRSRKKAALVECAKQVLAQQE